MRKLTQKVPLEEWIDRFNKIHGEGKYGYFNVTEIKNNKSIIQIYCNVHREFFPQMVSSHNQGVGCKKCGEKKCIRIKPFSEIIVDINRKYDDKYTLLEEDYKGAKSKTRIFCNEHKEHFNQIPRDLLRGGGCKVCKFLLRSLLKSKSQKQFEKEANLVHNNKFTYGEYKNSHINMDIICPEHGVFQQRPWNHLNGYECPKCNHNISKPEQEVADFISDYVAIEQSDKKQLKNKAELDIYIPSIKQAIEFDGLYWHSNKHVSNVYHKWKQDLCKQKNISLIQIFEDEWINQQEIVKSNLLNFIGKTRKTIYSSNCEVREVNVDVAEKFLNENHIKGHSIASIYLGLFFNDELVSMLTISKKESYHEILRYCNKIHLSVSSGFYKMLKYFETKYKPKQVTYTHDRRWSNINVFETAGFINKGNTSPSFQYTNGRFRYNNQTNSKDEQKIYDSGSIRFVKQYLTTLSKI